MWSKFKVSELRERLEKFNVPWRAVFLDGPCTWEVARQHVRDPALLEMLAVNGKLPGEGGENNQFRARTVAFDCMLRYELKTGQRFQHVLVLRPDIVADLGRDDPAQAVASVKDIVYYGNDLISMFPRKLATYVFTLPATLRSSHTRDKDAWQSLLYKLWNRSTGGALMLPHAHLALHGLPICGEGLQAIPNIACSNNESVSTTIGLVRDLWRVRGPQRVCVDRSRGASLEFLKDYFRRLGMREALFHNLSVCHEDM